MDCPNAPEQYYLLPFPETGWLSAVTQLFPPSEEAFIGKSRIIAIVPFKKINRSSELERTSVLARLVGEVE